MVGCYHPALPPLSTPVPKKAITHFARCRLQASDNWFWRMERCVRNTLPPAPLRNHSGFLGCFGAETVIHGRRLHLPRIGRSEEHTSDLQSLMRTSYAVSCLKKKTNLH